MNAKIIGGGVVVVAAIAVGVYFGVLHKGGDGAEAAKERADKLFASIKAKGGEASYGSATADGKGVIIKDVVVKKTTGAGKPTEVRIGEMRIKDYDWANPDQPGYAVIRYNKVQFPAIHDNAQFKEFSDVTGLKDVVINADVDYHYDKSTKTVEIKSADAEIEGMGTLSFSGKLDGIDIAQLQGLQGAPDPSKLMGVFGAMRVHSLRIAFKDAGAVAKMIKFGAHKEKKTEDQVKSEVLAKAAEGEKAPIKIAQEASKAAQSFIKSPGTFVIEAKPSAPFAMAQLMTLAGKFDPAGIDKMSETLGLHVRAE